MKAVRISKVRTYILFVLWTGLMAVILMATTGSSRSASGRPLTSISLEKMNMLYIGLENPVSVSVSGYRPDQIEVRAEGSTLKGSNGQYTINPTSTFRSIRLSVFVRGRSEPIHEADYRVRPVPKPEILFGTNAGPTISRGELTMVRQVNAGLGAAFAFEGVNYVVQSYTFVHAQKKGGVPYFEPVTGNRVSAGMKQRFQMALPGDMIVISEVRVAGPGGNRLVNGPTFTVK